MYHLIEKLRHLLINCMFLVTACMHATAFAQRIDLSSAFQSALESQSIVDVQLEFARGASFPAHVEVTQQGNGTLTLGPLSIRLMDLQDDGLVYANGGLLNLDILPTDRAMFVVSGIVNETDDKTSAILRQTSLLALFQWDEKAKEFRCIYSPDHLLDACRPLFVR